MSLHYPAIGPNDETKDLTVVDRQYAVVGASYVLVRSTIAHMRDLVTYGTQAPAINDKRRLILRRLDDLAQKLRRGVREEPSTKMHTPIVSVMNTSVEAEAKCLREVAMRVFRLLTMIDVEKDLGESPLFFYLNPADVSVIVQLLLEDDQL